MNTPLTLEDLLRQKPGPGFIKPDLPDLSVVDDPSEPENASQSYFKKGVTLLKEKSPFDALPYLYTAWVLDETCIKAANNIVIALWQLKCPDLALKTVKKILSIDPDNQTARSHLNVIERRLNSK
jgi:tetratricopeptide (TPR) repeat protein